MSAITRLHQTRSPILRVLVAATLLALIFAGGTAVLSHKTVTLTVDGASMTVPTMKSRVIDVVKENGFGVTDRDDLFPAADTPVHQSDTIVLRRSRPLEISTDGGGTEQVWTTASTVQEALAQLRMTDKAPLAASRGSRVPLGGMALPVVSPRTVQLDDAGVTRTVRLAAPNVAALLDAAGAPLQQSDTVNPAPSAPIADGMRITVTRVRIDKVTERLPLAPNNQRISDVSLNMSRQIVEDPGMPGTQDVTFAIARVNGVETGRLPVANVVVVPARDGVLRIGAKPGTEVPRCPTRASGTRWRVAKLEVIGASTPVTDFSVASNLIKTPGSATVV